MRTPRRKTLIAAFFCLVSTLYLFPPRSHPSEPFFPKVSWTDIYWMRWLPMEQRMGYWGQIDSAGFNLVVGLVDSTSTRNPYGVKYIGQSGELKATNDQGAQYDIGEIVAFGYDARFEAEELSYDSTKGYWFEFTTGNNVTDDSAFGGKARLAYAGVDSTGYLITGFSGLKTNLSTSTFNLQVHFRLKIVDNSSSDTVCLLEAYGNTGAGWFLASSRYVAANDFQDSSTYEDFSLPTFYAAKWQQMDYRVYWYGNYDLWVDRVHIYDSLGEVALNLDPDSIEAGFSRFNQWINSDNHYRFYPADEPKAIKFELHRWFDDYSTSVPPGHPGNAVTQNYSGYPWLYAAEVQRPELFLDYYPFSSYVDSASEGPNNVQQALNSFTDAMNPYTLAAKHYTKDFWMLVQGGAVRNTIGEYVLRNPQATEIRTQVWLALAHGAKGIGYFLYGGFHLANEWYEGLTEWNDTTERYEPTYRWYAVRDIHVVIDTLASTLLSLDWQGAGVCYDVASIAGSYIESVESAEFDSAWIEAGFFKDSVNTDYFMLVNRRCLSTEEQNITAYIDSLEMNTDAKMWYVIDQYSQDTTFTGAINGVIPFTTHLDPGEGKLFKLVPFPDSAFHGTAHPITWQGGIMVDGDVTVDSSQTLVVLPPAEIAFYANTDVMKTWDTTDCDLIINGGLRAIGTETDSIIFTSTGSSPNDWEGIRVIGTSPSAARIAHCAIEHAYTGIEFSNYCVMDTISNSTFFNNLVWGILVINSGCLITNNSICYDSSLQGGSKGIRVVNQDSVRVLIVNDNTIQDYWFGISATLCSACSTEITNTWISTGATPNATGLECCLGSNLRIEEVNITGDSLLYGLDLHESSAEITDVSVEGTPGYPVRYGARFYIDKGSVLRGSSFEDFLETGVLSEYSSNGAWPDLGTEGDHGINKVSSDSGILVRFLSNKKTNDTLMAQYNWWGEYPPDSSRFLGRVKFMPAFESEPEQPESLQQKITVSENIPITFELVQNYPNPFNPTTNIHFTIAGDGTPAHTTLRIYNILGQLVRTLVNEEKAKGTHTVLWDGRNNGGEEVSSGIYFYRLEAGSFIDTKKMVLLR